MEKRVAYIDNAKAICIILVVIGHLLIFCDLFENPIVDVLLKLIYSFHVPVFFILSGMLFSRHNLEISFWKYLKKKFLTLMVPYCFFEMLTCIIKMSIFGSSYINFRGGVYQLLTLNCSNGPDWFLPTLFFAELIFYVVQKYIKPQMVFWLAMLAMLSPVLSQDIHWNVIIVRVLVAFGFICTGFYGKHLVQKQQYSLKILIPVVFSYFLITLFNIKVDLYSVQVGNIIFYILESILGSFLFLLICKKIKMNRSLSFIGQNTIIILCTHQVVMDIFRHYHNFRDVVGLCIIGLLLIEPVCIFVLNKIPILIGKRN